MRATITLLVAFVSFLSTALAMPVAETSVLRRGSLLSVTSNNGVCADPKSAINIGGLVNGLLSTVDVTLMTLVGTVEQTALGVNVDIGLGDILYEAEGVLETVEGVVNSALSALMGVPVNCSCNKKRSTSNDPFAIDLGMHVMGLTNKNHCSALNANINVFVGKCSSMLASVGISLNVVGLTIDGM